MSLKDVLGLGLKVLGDLQSNQDEAQRARDSANWLMEQATHFRVVASRQKDVLGREVKQLRGTRASATAGNGVALKGSYLDMDDQVQLLEQMESDAIDQQANMQIREATLKAQGLRAKADKLNSFEYNALQTAGTIAGSYAGASLLGDAGSLLSTFGPKYSGDYTLPPGKHFGKAVPDFNAPVRGQRNA